MVTVVRRVRVGQRRRKSSKRSGLGLGASSGVDVGVRPVREDSNSSHNVITRNKGRTVEGSTGKKRTSLSTSNLARPKQLIHKLAGRIQEYIHFPDSPGGGPHLLYTVLGTVAGNMMRGHNIWLMLVGAPSSGKTMLLESIQDIPRVLMRGAVKTTAALLSGTAQRERKKGATGGLLRELGNRGIWVMKDFTSVLSMNKDNMTEIVGAMRETFDGRYTRSVGTDGGDTMVWLGRIGFLGACTPVIDRYGEEVKELGERWVYFRIPDSDWYGETRRSLKNGDPERTMLELRAEMSMFFDSLGLVWDEPAREVTDDEIERIYAMTSLVCKARSYVPRHKYTHEIVDMSSSEGVSRISNELKQLYLGLERIGIEDAKERWDVVGKVAMDSLPRLRAGIVLALYNSDDVAVKISEIQQRVQCGKRVTNEAIEDLQIFNVIRKQGGRVGFEEEGHAHKVLLTDWARQQLRVGWDYTFEENGESDEVEGE